MAEEGKKIKQYYWNCLGSKPRSENVPVSRSVIWGDDPTIYGKMFGERLKVSFEKSVCTGLLVNPEHITMRDIIRCFYDGVKIEVENNFPQKIIVVLCGRYGEYTTNEFGKVLGVSINGPRCPVEANTWIFDDDVDSQQLTPLRKLQKVLDDDDLITLKLPLYHSLPVYNQKLLDVVRCSLLPRDTVDNDFENLTFKEVFVLGHIVEGIPINYASLVMGKICNVLASNDMCLCYDNVVGRLYHETSPEGVNNIF